MVVYIIAVAAGIGSLVGVFFQVRVRALLWSTPILCFLYGCSVFLAPFMQKNDAVPQIVRSVTLQLSDLTLFIPVLIAGAAGTFLASSMTRYSQKHGSSRGSSRPVNRRRLEKVVAEAPRDILLARAEEVSRRRVQFDPRRQPPAPIFEVDYASPLPERREAAMAEALSPAPPRKPIDPSENRRGHGRRRSALAGEIVFEDGARLGCTIQDLSVGGARVRLMGPWPAERPKGLNDLTNGMAHDVAVRWKAGPIAGLRFTGSRDLRDAGPSA